MHISQSHLLRLHISHLGVTLLWLAIASISSCTPSNPSSSNISSAGSPAANPANNASNITSEQFAAILGSQEDGWLPKVLANKGLKKGLTPAETGKIIPGAEQVSTYGFSKVAVNDIPGLKQYEFYYAQDSSGKPTQLGSVKLLFDPAVNQAYPDLVRVLSNKYGPAKPEDVKQQAIVWVGPDFVTAQLTKQVTDFGGYELNLSLQEE